MYNPQALSRALTSPWCHIPGPSDYKFCRDCSEQLVTKSLKHDKIKNSKILSNKAVTG